MSRKNRSNNSNVSQTKTVLRESSKPAVIHATPPAPIANLDEVLDRAYVTPLPVPLAPGFQDVLRASVEPVEASVDEPADEVAVEDMEAISASDLLFSEPEEEEEHLEQIFDEDAEARLLAAIVANVTGDVSAPAVLRVHDNGEVEPIMPDIVIPPIEDTSRPAYAVYAKQVLRYNGNDPVQAWQLFCTNFSGMLQFLHYSPDMTLLTTDQKHLLDSIIAA